MMSNRVKTIAGFIHNAEQNHEEPKEALMMIDAAIRILNGYRDKVANEVEELNATRVYPDDILKNELKGRLIPTDHNHCYQLLKQLTDQNCQYACALVNQLAKISGGNPVAEFHYRPHEVND